MPVPVVCPRSCVLPSPGSTHSLRGGVSVTRITHHTLHYGTRGCVLSSCRPLLLSVDIGLPGATAAVVAQGLETSSLMVDEAGQCPRVHLLPQKRSLEPFYGSSNVLPKFQAELMHHLFMCQMLGDSAPPPHHTATTTSSSAAVDPHRARPSRYRQALLSTLLPADDHLSLIHI